MILTKTRKKLQVAEDFFGPLNYEDALNSCEALGVGWRIPSKDELIEIYERFGKQFTNSAHNFFWCSSVRKVVDETKLELIRSGIYRAGIYRRGFRPSMKKPMIEYRENLNFADGSIEGERICNNCFVLAVFDLE